MATATVGAGNLADPDFWVGEGVEEELVRLRRESPITWHEHPESGRGMWSVVRYADITAISRDTATFVNRDGVRPHHDVDNGLVQPGTGVMQTMDPPEHVTNRRFVSPSFSKRRIDAMGEYVRGRSRDIVTELP